MVAGLISLKIDGIDFTKDVFTSDGLVVDLVLDEATGTLAYGIASDLTFTGAAYDLLRLRFFQSCIDCFVKLPMTVEMDCCADVLEFEIFPHAVRFDPVGCVAVLSGIEPNNLIPAFDYLNNNVWWLSSDNERFWLYGNYPYRYFAIQPTFWQRIRDFLAGLFDGHPYDQPQNLFYHPVFYVAEVLEWNCAKAGITFESDSIFQAYGEYRRMVMMHAANVNGYRGDYPNRPPIEQNMPLQTPLELLQDLNPVFNAEFRLYGGALRFETQEWWDTNVHIIGDLEALYASGQIEEPPLFQLDSDRNQAYGRYEYASETIDTVCNKVRPYQHAIVPWKLAGDHCKRGRYSVVLPWSCTHIANDLAWREQKRNESNITLNLMTDQLWHTEGVMTNGQTQLPKLMILTAGARTRQEAFLERRRPVFLWGDPDNANAWEYGWQLNFNRNDPDSLYTRFHKYSAGFDAFEPRQYLTSEDLTFAPTDFCAMVQSIREHGIQIGVTTPYGIAIPKTGVRLDFSEKTITLTDLSIRCQNP